jgi:hypothetical protein
MPRYFFHFDQRVQDTSGLDLPDDNAARREAEAMAGDLRGNERYGGGWRVIVTNQNGEDVTELPATWRSSKE